jgi:hypothetical protein
MGTIYATGTKIAIDCIVFKPSQPIRAVSAEVNYEAQKNLINLSDEESEKIVKQLLEKQEQENKKQNNTGVLIQWDWKAVYNPPKYPDGYDSITVTMSGRAYTFPGVYGKKERDRYMKNIWAGTWCVSYIQWPHQEQWTENVLIKGTYYYPPNHGDCMSGVRTFGFFDSFSPSGYYIIYRVYWWEWSETIMIDTRTGRNILDTSNDSRSLISWTPDYTRMLYYTEWWDMEKPLWVYITRPWYFPNWDLVVVPWAGLQMFYANDSYIYILERYSDYYLRILDINTFEEVYTRIIKE